MLTTFTPNSFSDTATYDGVSNEVRIGGRLITNDGFYIADASGNRIILGGLSSGDSAINETAVTYTPDLDITT